jgi:death-on-curing protein
MSAGPGTTPDAGAASHGPRNHPFVDGNKRTAFVAMETFPRPRTDSSFLPHEACVMKTLDSRRDIDEASFAQWIRDHLAPRDL